MIEAIMYIALGFLAAGLLALLIIPALWKRAVRLTRRRVEASTPMTQKEIQADRDRLRAEFAVSTRRLEMSVAELRRRNAEHMVQIARQHDALRAGGASGYAPPGETGPAVAIEAEQANVRGPSERKLAERRAHAEALAARDQSIEALENRVAELQANLDGRKVELIARETRIQNMEADLAAARAGPAGDGARVAALQAEIDMRETVIATEKTRIATLEMRLERVRDELEERKEDLDDHARELAGAVETIAANDREIASLRHRVAALDQRLKDSSRASDNIDKTVKSLEQTRADLETKLAAVAAERDAALARLREQDERGAGNGAEAGRLASERDENTVLRETLGEVAAKVARLTATLEGSDSVVERILTDAQAKDAPAKPGDGPADDKARTSLADRMRALKQRAEVAEPH